jgi:hypothetical protein
MAHSKKPHSIGASRSLEHMRDVLAFPARTPGSLGINDAADPTRFSHLGDTPGPLGWNDHASPFHLNVPRLELKSLADPRFAELRPLVRCNAKIRIPGGDEAHRAVYSTAPRPRRPMSTPVASGLVVVNQKRSRVGESPTVVARWFARGPAAPLASDAPHLPSVG